MESAFGFQPCVLHKGGSGYFCHKFLLAVTFVAEVGGGSEAVEALVALGYSEQEAKKAIGLLDGNLSVEETIKEALKKLMK